MPQADSQQFKIQINFTKAYQDADGNAFIEGIASGPEVDLTNERMSTDALRSMVSAIGKRIIEFRDAHKDEWNDDLGEVVELSLTDDYHLFYKAKLDLNLSGAKDLWYRVTQLGKKYGVSIGGGVVKAGWEYAAEVGREIYTYFDVALYEISITRQAAYQYSFANAVTKSLPRSEELMIKPADSLQKSEAQELIPDTNLAEAEAAVPTDAEVESIETNSEPTEETPDTGESTPEAAVPTDAEVEKTAEDDAAAAPVVEEADANSVATSEDQTSPEAEPVVADEPAADAPATEGTENVDGEIEAQSDAEAPANTGEDVSKALRSAHAQVEDLQKSLSDAENQIRVLTKKLADAETQVESAQADVLAKEGELETATAALEEAQTREALIKGRKAHVFSKFDGFEISKRVEDTTEEAQNIAAFIVGNK